MSTSTKRLGSAAAAAAEMADDDDATRDEAPDLKILGDEVTFQPSGVEPAEEALMKPLGRFRTDPLQ